MAPPVSPRPATPPRRPLAVSFASLLLLAFAACDDDDDPPPPIGIAPDPIVTDTTPLPGVVVQITALRGGTGAGGNARVGDLLTVDFTVATNAGEPLELSTATRGAIMVSGPTFNYQRVIASQSDLLTKAVKTAVGRYSYTFPVPVPAAYLPPLNDTAELTTGELTDQPLLSGTYTVGIEVRKDYTIGGVVYRDPGNTTLDFLFGDATAIDAREVVTFANCNQCHGELRGHGNNRNDVRNCLLCHTAGAEDRNTPTVAGGTPGESIDFRVMIHKIHAGAHLPSVLGVTTNPDGTRKYDATPKPYRLIGFNDTVIDLSHVGFPVWPSMYTGMPRDTGYAALTSTQQSLENSMRQAPVDCAKCHGDPDGAGPLPAPRQGELIYMQPTRAACASCHDDWVPEHEYTANTQTMPIQRDDAACKNCHRESGTPLDIVDAHRHPLADPALARGLVFDVTSVTDTGGDGDGSFDVGEKITVAMQIKDGSGAAIPAASLSRIEFVLNGPTANPNIVHCVRVAQAGIGAGPNYTFNVPQNHYYEPVGVSGATLQTFVTAHAPHWNVTNAATSLLRRTGVGTASALAAEAPATQNWIDVTPGTGVNFTAGGYIVIEDLVVARREYLRVQRVDGDRLWFSSLYSPTYAPGLRQPHTLGSSVTPVTTVAVPTTSYTLAAVTGTIVETTEFGAGEILVSYTSDFVVPAVYPGALNDEPALQQDWGNWRGLALLPGTYRLGIHGTRQFTVPVFTENTTYTEASQPNVRHVRVGDVATTTTVDRIDGASTCNSCHQDIQFHGGNRRGYDTCLLCHGTAGAGDAANYVYPTGAVTPETTVDFRTMLHKIHRGRDLDAGANYQVAGNGGTPHSYEHVGFPYMPGGVADCASCHGKSNQAWMVPAERNHPAQLVPTRAWFAACGSCHDATAEHAHMDANTAPSGAEACAICHGIGEDKEVPKVHLVR